MEWVWKVFLAGFLATGTCGAPFVEEAPPETPPGDMMKKPDPTPPKPKPPEPTYSWQKISVPGYADGTFRKIVGQPRNPDYPNAPYLFFLLSKGKNNFTFQVFEKDFSGYGLETNLNKKFKEYEILDINYTKEEIASPELSGTTTDSGGKAFVNGNANLTFSTSCKPGRYYPYADPTPSTTNKLVAIHNGVAVGPSGVFSVPGDGFPIAEKVCHLFKLNLPRNNDVIWLYNDLTGVWVGKAKQFFIGKTSTGAGNFIVSMEYPFTSSVVPGISVDDKNGAGLNAISGLSDSDVLVVGNQGTVMRYNGTSWNDVDFPKEINSANLYAVHATSYGAYLVGGDWGIVMRYQDGIWNEFRLPTASKVVSLFALASDDMYALTEDGRLFRYYLHDVEK